MTALHHPRRHTGHPIADLSFTEGVVVCGCGWRSVRGLGCEELAGAYRGHRRALGLPVMTLSSVVDSRGATPGCRCDLHPPLQRSDGASGLRLPAGKA